MTAVFRNQICLLVKNLCRSIRCSVVDKAGNPQTLLLASLFDVRKKVCEKFDLGLGEIETF